MRRLYRTLKSLLEADAGMDGDLAWLLGAVDGDTRIYQTAVQEHVQAANTGIRWVTFNKAADDGDGSDQTTAIREAEIDFHIWARESDSAGVEAVHDRLKVVLDGRHQALHDLDPRLLVMLVNYVSYTKQFEAEQKLWHVTATYAVMYADLDELP
jgi:hypothetical protein